MASPHHQGDAAPSTRRVTSRSRRTARSSTDATSWRSRTNATIPSSSDGSASRSPRKWETRSFEIGSSAWCASGCGYTAGFLRAGTSFWLPRTPRRGRFTPTTSRPICRRSCASFHDRIHCSIVFLVWVVLLPVRCVSPRAVAAEAHADVPVPADVLGVRDRGGARARHRRRRRARDVARAAVQSAVPRRLRPGAAPLPSRSSY